MQHVTEYNIINRIKRLLNDKIINNCARFMSIIIIEYYLFSNFYNTCFKVCVVECDKTHFCSFTLYNFVYL